MDKNRAKHLVESDEATSDAAQPKDIVKTEKAETGILIPEIIKSEINLLFLPFFALSRKGLKKKTETKYEDVIFKKDTEQRIHISWQVTANTKLHYPGPFDREVHKVVEQIITEILEEKQNVANPIQLGSFYGLCKRMGIGTSGKNKKTIRESLRRITVTAITSEGSFYSKGHKRWISDTFHLYERVVFKDEELPGGTVADTNYLFLGSWYLQSLNSFYVKPIDYRYFKTLKRKIASRLYEILGLRFYRLNLKKKHKPPFVWFYYDKLCQLLPIIPQKDLSHAKLRLDPAHNELLKTEFLADFRWGQYKNRWGIAYYPGKRVWEEMQASPKIEFFEPAEISARQLALPRASNLDAPELVCYFQKTHNKMTDYQPTQKELKKAKELINEYGKKQARYITDYAIQKAPQTNYKMKYFGAALGYADEAIKAFHQQETKRQQEIEERQRLLKKEKAQEQKDKKWLENPRFTKDMGAALGFRKKTFEIKNKRKPTEKEIEQMKQEMVDTKRQILFQKYHLQ